MHHKGYQAQPYGEPIFRSPASRRSARWVFPVSLTVRRLKGEAYMVRHDDFVLCFQSLADALCVQDVLSTSGWANLGLLWRQLRPDLSNSVVLPRFTPKSEGEDDARRLIICWASPSFACAGNPHAAICGSRRRVTASGDPVRGRAISLFYPTRAYS